MKILLYLFLLIGIPLSIHAADFYISPTGDDSSGDGSISSPWRTLGEAQNHVGDGDTIYCREGVYSATKEWLWCGGSVSQPITIRNYPGETPIFDGAAETFSESEAIIAFETQNLILDGLVVRNNDTGRGISAYQSENITVQNCTVYNIATRGLGGSGRYMNFISNEVYNCCNANENGAMGSSGWPSALSTYYWWSTGDRSSNIVIRGNYVHDNWGEGINALNSDGVTIADNRVADNYAVLIYLDSARYANVERNYLTATNSNFFRSDNGNAAVCISIANELSTDEPPEDILIANNILYSPYKGIGFWQADTNPGTDNRYENVRIYYNVILCPSNVAMRFDAPIGSTSGNECRNNIIESSNVTFDTPGAWTFSHNDWINGIPAVAAEPNSISADPQFISPVVGGPASGYQVAAISPVYAAGTPVSSVLFDYWGNPRDAVTPTMGIHETIPEPAFMTIALLLCVVFTRNS